MNILVTGGAGYIGSTCVEQLNTLGHKTYVVDNLSNSTGSFLDKRAEFYKLDLTNKPALAEVFHLSTVFSDIEIFDDKSLESEEIKSLTVLIP